MTTVGEGVKLMVQFIQVMELLDARRRAKVHRQPIREQVLNPCEELALCWLGVEGPSAAAVIAKKTGRHRQAMSRTLWALHGRGYVEPLDSPWTGKAVAWRLTSEGERQWRWLAGWLGRDEDLLREGGVSLGRLVAMLTDVIKTFRKHTPRNRQVLMDVPEHEDEVAEWDL